MWAAKRRLFITLLLTLVVVLFVGGVILIKKASEQPLCSDGKQNGSESGVDCGGACTRVCLDDTRPLRVNWARVVPVTDTVYSLAFEVVNRNYDSVAFHASYVCNLYSDDFTLVQETKGLVNIPPSGKHIIANTGLKYVSEDGRPTSVTCRFENIKEWLRLPKLTTPSPFSVDLQNFSYEGMPKIKATITNIDSKRVFKEVTVVAGVYDATNTLVGVSTYLVDRLDPTEAQSVSYTWPQSFKGVAPYRVEFSPIFEFPDYKLFRMGV
jgi:hypothetical protein